MNDAQPQLFVRSTSRVQKCSLCNQIPPSQNPSSAEVRSTRQSQCGVAGGKLRGDPMLSRNDWKERGRLPRLTSSPAVSQKADICMTRPEPGKAAVTSVPERPVVVNRSGRRFVLTSRHPSCSSPHLFPVSPLWSKRALDQLPD